MKEIDNAVLDPEEKIKALIRLHVRIALEDKSSVTVFNDEWKHLQEPHLSRFLQMRRSYETTYLRIIREGIEAGIFRRLDAFIIYQHILSSLRWLHQPGVKKSKLTETDITEQITTILIKGISI
jgi:hypothetical protein